MAHEEGNLNDLRAILGNEPRSRPIGKENFRSRTARSLPGSPGDTSRRRKTTKSSAVANLSWPGPPKKVQFMVKDSSKYASTGGWGFAQFNDGKPADEAMHKTCFPCHEPAKDRDFVFTRYAP